MSARPCRLHRLAAVVAVTAAASFASTFARHGVSAAGIPSDDKAIAHVLDRLGFGPRPGDVENVRRVGLMQYIEQQLHPESIDDSALEERLAPLETLRMSSAEIARDYFVPAQMERRQQQRARTAQAGPNAAGAGAGQPPDTPDARRRPTQAMMGQRQVVIELNEQKILRAVYSERQLQELLTDFWFNHFNVFAGKGPERIMLTEYERDVIRPHVLGRFRDLLGATAHSPAMLFYLDNWMSTDPSGLHADPRQDFRQRNRARLFGPRRPDQADMMARQQRNRPTGLNENYGRELMELHTLGVDGGYTQKDVVEVARAFTGWTIAQPRLGGDFRFDARMHDPGEKHVLGHTIKAGGGEKDGEQVLDILARHPSTARFISTKLARRLVGDTPPASLVERASKRFSETDGDIREVVRTIVTSPEFFSPEAYRAKVKNPFEFVVSALRASGAEMRTAPGIGRALQQLGMPLYMAQPPTGYGDTAETWVNTGGLVNRMNFAVELVNNRLPGVRVRLRGDDLAATRDDLMATILQGTVSEATASTLSRATDPAQLAALALGAPEFQRK